MNNEKNDDDELENTKFIVELEKSNQSYYQYAYHYLYQIIYNLKNDEEIKQKLSTISDKTTILCYLYSASKISYSAYSYLNGSPYLKKLLIFLIKEILF